MLNGATRPPFGRVPLVPSMYVAHFEDLLVMALITIPLITGLIIGM